MVPAIGTAEVVLWGIRSGLKLAEQGRKAYAQATANRALTLPLPNFDADLKIGDAKEYFAGGGRNHLQNKPVIKDLYDRVRGGPLQKEDEQALIRAYIICKWEDDSQAGLICKAQPEITMEALESWLRVRQWARGKAQDPSAAQRVIGTLIEVGIDYFAHVPGVIDETSSTGRVLKGFLKSVDGLNFSEARAQEIAKGMFLGVLETLPENVSLLGGDKKTEILVETVSKGLLAVIRDRTKELAGKDFSKQERIEVWGQMVLRSMLQSMGTVVLTNPGTYLGIKDQDQQALVASIGTCILKTILDPISHDVPNKEPLDLTTIFSRETLEQLIQTALVTVGEYPSLLNIEPNGLRLILTQMAKELAIFPSLLSLDILPEIMRLVVGKTAQNLDLLWPESDRSDPRKHLLITASRELLFALSKPPEQGSGWELGLNKNQILEIAEEVLGEVVQNPEWLVKEAGEKSTVLSRTIQVTLSALKRAPAGRLNAETSKKVIKTVLKSVALRRELLKKIRVDREEKETIGVILDALTNALLSSKVDRNVRWVLGRNEIFSQIACLALQKLAENGPSEEAIVKLRKILGQAAENIKAAGPWRLESILDDIAKVAA